MMNIGINGYGRIGRILIRQLCTNSKHNIKAINTRSEVDECLLKYDSVFGAFMKGGIRKENKTLYVGKHKIDLYNETDIAKIPWDDSIAVVVDCSGKFKTHGDLSKHLQKNVKKVILSSPPKDDRIPMYIIGVNDAEYDGENIISCASCTTNGIAPILKILNDNYWIKAAHITTIHAVTTSDNLLDGSQPKEKRRGRAAMESIRETSTGAAKATVKIFPDLEGRVFVNAYRVPVPDGSLLDMTLEFEEEVGIEDIKSKLMEAEQGSMKGILETTQDAIVSCDCIGNYNSAIVDINSIKKTTKNIIKLTAFYDNEWGYTARLVDLLDRLYFEIQKSNGG